MDKRVNPRSRWSWIVFIFFNLLGSIWQFGCDSPFPPATLVDRPRLLAVRAVPPDATLSDTVRLEALVAFPEEKVPKFDITWAVCFFEFDNAAGDIPCPGPDSYELGANQLHVELPLTEWVQWLKDKGIDIDSLLKQPEIDKLPWILIGFKLEAEGVSLRSVKRIKLRLNDESPPANRNPIISGITINEKSPTEPIHTIRTNQTHNIHPIYAEDSRELYQPEDLEEPRQEDHLFSWFSTCGSFSDRRTIVDVDKEGNLLQNNRWKLELEPSSGNCTLWLVLRDGRYGVDWKTYHFNLESS